MTISPLERGSLVHSILERFIRQVQEQGTLPAAQVPWTEEHKALLMRIARQAFKEAEESGITGKELLWGLEREAILADLEDFLEEDARLRAQYGVAPDHVEMRFGFTDGEATTPPAQLKVEGLGTLLFRGFVDRVDLDSAGREALVLDYKTGGRSSYEALKKDPVDRGRRLQLPIYALAVRQALGEDVHVRAAYWFATTRGGFALRPPQPIAFEEVEETFTEAVSVIAGGIMRGLFPANPGGEDRGSFENCRYCDFNSLCLSRRDIYWRWKQTDPRLSSYLELSGIEDTSV